MYASPIPPPMRRLRSVVQALSITLCWSCLAASLAAYMYVSTTVFHQPFHVGLRHLKYFDLRVYRGAGWRVLHDRPLYAQVIVGRLGFTYPPFAAVIFVPLALLPLHLDKQLMLAINVLSLLVMLHCAMTLASRGSRRLEATLARPLVLWAVAAFAASAMLWLEPFTTALGYGQIDPVIGALVLLDLSLPDTSRWKGSATGVAAAIKLTPLLYLPYLLLTGRRRPAIIGTAAFAATAAIGFAVASADSTQYWGGLFLQSSRVGPAADVGNQSLRAALARLAGTSHPGLLTLAAVAVVGLAGLTLAVRAGSRGNELAGFSLCAVTVLLVTPVTWSHHWTLAIPGIVALALLAYDRRSPGLGLLTIGLLAVGYGYLPQRAAAIPTKLVGIGTLITDPYVLTGLGVLLTAAVIELMSYLRARNDGCPQGGPVVAPARPPLVTTGRKRG